MECLIEKTIDTNNNKTYDKIGIIIPIYKVELYLDRCIKSVLNQTFTNFDLILVDDGSPDNCPKLCDEWAKKDNRIKVIHKSNGGLSDARNTGLNWLYENSNFEWITFIDSDDWIHKEMLMILYNAATKYNKKISVCNYESTDGNDPIVNIKNIDSKIYNVEEFCVKHTLNFTIACAKLYHKDCFKNIRYPIGKIHEDEFTTYRVMFQESSILYVNLPLYAYYNNFDGITKSNWKPSRLDALEAVQQQIYYFESNNYVEACKKSKIKYIRILASQITMIKEKEFYKYKRELRLQLKKTIRKYVKEGIISFNNDKFYFTIAYPHIMNLFWKINGQIDKIKKEGKNVRK